MLTLSENARLILEKRYLQKDDRGENKETPEQLFTRVARDIAEADAAYGHGGDGEKTAMRFYEMMTTLDFLPNSPTLMNAGTGIGQLSACFVLPVGDSIDDIFDSLKHAALIHKTGGGTGFSFSRLRPRNDIVKTTFGVSSGPISFMEVFDSATNAIKQGGKRRGANMGILNVHHPDILEFITAKENLARLTNFNLSVALTDAFMTALEQGGEYELTNPRSGQKAGKLAARAVWDKIMESAWKTGEPGVVFIDEINRFNPTPALGAMESTNPCGEQPLLPYESCNLGSINLANMVRETAGGFETDWEKLGRTVADGVHFLDNVIDRNKYPLPQIRDMTLGNRKIGLGVMGWADMLYMLHLPYNSEEAVSLGSELQKFISEKADVASIELAVERGSFPNWEKSVYGDRKQPMRNATRTTIAPTGTISLIANVSSGIEPVFALAWTRRAMENEKLTSFHPYFKSVAEKMPFFSRQFIESITEKGSLYGLPDIPEDFRRIFVTAHEIEPDWHIRMQAAFQDHTDNAVSKTINFPAEATLEDVEKAYVMAWQLHCKGLTIYRDGSRDNVISSGSGTQTVAEADKEKENLSEIKKRKPRKRPQVTIGKTIRVETGCGHLYITINEDENGLVELFATIGKAGGCANSQIEAISRLISLALRSNIDPMTIIKQLKGIRCPNPSMTLSASGKVLSCADGIARAMEIYLREKEELFERTPETDGQIAIPSGVAELGREIEARQDKSATGSVKREIVGVCPDCSGHLIQEEGCAKCPDCGYSKCG